MPWRCPTCGAQNPTGTNVCRACGTARPAPTFRLRAPRGAVGGAGIGPAWARPRRAGAGAVAAAGAGRPRRRLPSGRRVAAFWQLGGLLGRMRGSRMWQNVRDKVIPFMVLAIIGLLLTLGLGRPLGALGIPAANLAYLGAACIFYAFFHILPNPSLIMNEAREQSERVALWRCPQGHTVGTGARPGGAGTDDPNASPTCPRGHTVPGPGGVPIDAPLSVGRTRTTLSNEHLGLFVMRSTLKILIIIMLIFQFSPIGGINNTLIPTVLMFILYFTLPTSYRTSQPHRILESWFRMFLGFAMAIMLAYFFTPQPDMLFQGTIIFSAIMLMVLGGLLAFITVFLRSAPLSILVGVVGMVIVIGFLSAFIAPLYAVPSTAFFFLTFAYFATMPVREEDTEHQVQTTSAIAVSLSNLVGNTQDEWDIFGTGLFIGFVLVSMIPVIGSWLQGMPVQVMFIFGLLFFFSMFTGAMSRESRPYVGVVVLMFAIVAFSFAYTDTVGTAVFGQYWGTVESTGEMFFGPVSEQLNRANCEAYATWLCVSEGPVKCAEERLKCERLEAEAIGSQQAVEFQNFKTDPIDYTAKGTNTIYFELANAGDYDAEDIELTIEEENGWVTRVTATEADIAVGTVTMDEDSCIGGNYTGDNTCVWPGVMPKGGKGAVIFTVDWDKATSRDKGLYPEIRMKASYDYSVEASYKVDVRSSEELRRLLLAGESLGGEIAKFSGGPITASLWTPKYIESGKATLVTASLMNTKNGVAFNPSYCIYVPEEGIVTEPSKDADITGGDCAPKAGAKAVKCSWDKIRKVSAVSASAKPLNFETCHFRLAIDIGPAPQKQLPIVGEASYEYVIDYTKKDVMLAFVSEEFV